MILDQDPNASIVQEVDSAHGWDQPVRPFHNARPEGNQFLWHGGFPPVVSQGARMLRRVPRSCRVTACAATCAATFSVCLMLSGPPVE